jgi:hypothetical protein
MMPLPSPKTVPARIYALLPHMLPALLFILLLASQAMAFGVAPSREIVPYKPGTLTENVRILNSERMNGTVAIYLSGDLADYATVEKQVMRISADQTEIPFSYTVNLPSSGLEPGERTLDVRVVQLPEKDIVPQDKSIVFVGVMVAHQLRVQVPYPGTYAQGELFVGNAQVGAAVPFSVAIYNKGDGALTATGFVTIKGPTNEELGRATLSSQKVESGQEGKLEGQADVKLNAGEYIAEAVITYGDGRQLLLRKSFYVGNLLVDIQSLSVKDFKLGNIAKFDIKVASKWNQPLNDVYGELFILDKTGSPIASFKTGTTTLGSYATDVISAFWDTQGVASGEYGLRFVLHYADKQSERLFRTVIGLDSIVVDMGGAAGAVTGISPKATGQVSIMTVLVIILIIVNIGWFVYFKRFRKAPPS